jgi:hypothetical protein
MAVVPGPGGDEVGERELVRAAVFTRWADRRLLDPLLGVFLPGFGDIAGSIAGLYLVALAAKRNAPRGLLARMVVNLALDCVVGALPIVGDVADIFFRANQRNLRLLRQRWGPPALDKRRGSFALVGAVVLFVGAMAVSILVLLLLAEGLSLVKTSVLDDHLQPPG